MAWASTVSNNSLRVVT